MKPFRMLTGSAGLFFFAAALVACGGSGGSSASAIPGQPATTPLTTPASYLPEVSVPQSTASPGTFPHHVAISTANFIAVGPDRLYFSDSTAIGAVQYDGTGGGTVDVGDGGAPAGLVEGIDGAIYYADSTSNLNKLVPTGDSAGTMTHWNDFGATTGGTNDVTSDPNGNLVTTQTFGTAISTPDGNPQIGVLRADGEIWFVTEPGGYMVSFQPN